MAKSRKKLLLKEKALEEIVFGRDVIGRMPHFMTCYFSFNNDTKTFLKIKIIQ